MRIVGPNCLGILAPHRGVNASFAHLTPQKGDVAFVTQSGAVATSILDWASARGIGFSHVVSLGLMSDVDFGDMLDYLALDPRTRSILLYVEAIDEARKFLSAARWPVPITSMTLPSGARGCCGGLIAFFKALTRLNGRRHS